MPNTRSAKKRLKQDKARRSYNRAAKSAVKTQVKKVLAALDEGDLATANNEYIAAARKLDKACAHGVIHKNAAARRKSRLQKRILSVKNGGSES